MPLNKTPRTANITKDAIDDTIRSNPNSNNSLLSGEMILCSTKCFDTLRQNFSYTQISTPAEREFAPRK